MPRGVYTHKKGYKRPPLSKEWREKISISKKANPTRYWLGKKRDGSSWIGKIPNEETRKKMSLARIGKIPWNKGKTGIKTGVRGSQHYLWAGGLPNCVDCNKTLKNRTATRCVDCYKKTNPHKAEKNVNWKNGISKIRKTERQLMMQTGEYKLWRKAVFERDNHTCVLCKKRGVQLNADHIKTWKDYPELRFNLKNGRTLCVECHRKTDTYGYANKKLLLNNK